MAVWKYSTAENIVNANASSVVTVFFTSVMIDCSETPFGTAETSDSAKQTCRSGNRNRSASATTAVLNSSIIDVPAAAVAVLPVIVYSDAVTGRKLVRKTERFKNACRVISNSVFSAVYRMPDSAKTSSSSTALSSTLEAESPAPRAAAPPAAPSPAAKTACPTRLRKRR